MGFFCSQLWRLNSHSLRWKKIRLDGDDPQLVPDQLASHATVVHQDRMLMFGGTGAPFGLTTSNHLFTLNFNTIRWSKIPATSQVRLTVTNPGPFRIVKQNCKTIYG